jgi:hypothetical protein
MFKFILVFFLMIFNFLICIKQHYESANCSSMNQSEILKDSSGLKQNDTVRFYSVRDVFATYQLKK